MHYKAYTIIMCKIGGGVENKNGRGGLILSYIVYDWIDEASQV